VEVKAIYLSALRESLWGSRDIASLILNLALDGFELSTSRPGRFISDKEIQYPLIRGWVGTRGGLSGLEKRIIS
jgi:hypothetical protein